MPGSGSKISIDTVGTDPVNLVAKLEVYHISKPFPLGSTIEKDISEVCGAVGFSGASQNPNTLLNERMTTGERVNPE